MTSPDFRALLKALVDALPKCDFCGGPGTKVWGPRDRRYCDGCFARTSWAACVGTDRSTAEATRAALLALAEPDEDINRVVATKLVDRAIRRRTYAPKEAAEIAYMAIMAERDVAQRDLAAVRRERDAALESARWARTVLRSVSAALGDRLLAKGPLSDGYAHAVLREVESVLRGHHESDVSESGARVKLVRVLRSKNVNTTRATEAIILEAWDADERRGADTPVPASAPKSDAACSECGGDGVDLEDSTKNCWKCDGSGNAETGEDMTGTPRVIWCPACAGSGKAAP